MNRSIKLRDELTSGIGSSAAERPPSLIKSGGYNFGTIMNFKKTEGINEHAGANSFRKWTGMPQTTRANKKLQAPGLSDNHAKVVAEHRRRTAYNANEF